MIEELLNTEGADLEKPNPNGNYPIHQICEHQSLELLQKIIKKNVNLNIVNRDKQTALHIACKNNWIEGVKLLLEHNADSDLQDNEGKKPPDLTDNTDILSLF